MKILWIGSYVSDEMFNNMPVKSVGQASGFTAQRSIIGGLDDNLKSMGVVMDTINIQGIPPYPKCSQKRCPRQVWSRNGDSLDVCVEFNNTKLFRVLSKEKSLIREVLDWVNKNKDEEAIHVFVYEPVLARLKAISKIKKYSENIKCHLIVPDVPEYVGKGTNKVVKFLKLIRKKLVDRYLKYVDDYIFFADEMAKYYNTPNDNYMVMEGSIDQRDVDFLLENQQTNDDFILMYSGAICTQRAIPRFLEAFNNYKNDNVKLWFTGGGDCDELVRRYAEKDSRITHYGFLDTREEVLSLESKATALLHIRDKDALSSRFCFPSKLFEYMVSGKPVITVKISGIPDEYYNYLIELEELTYEGLSKVVEKLVSMNGEEMKSFGEKARRFVLKTKTAKNQAKRIIDFAMGSSVFDSKVY